MNRISKTVYFKEEEYEKIVEEISRLSKEGKKILSFSQWVNNIIFKHLNGNTPPTLPETKPDIPKPADPVTNSFNDIEI